MRSSSAPAAEVDRIVEFTVDIVLISEPVAL